MFFIQWSLEKQLGETCGPCFNPDTNYDCGKCANNLACQPGNPQLPDQPGSCVKEEDFKGKTKQKYTYKYLGVVKYQRCSSIEYKFSSNYFP